MADHMDIAALQQAIAQSVIDEHREAAERAALERAAIAAVVDFEERQEAADRAAVDYLKIDLETGEIIQHGKMPRGVIRRLIEQGEPFIFGTGSWETHFVDVTTKSKIPRLRAEMGASLAGATLRNLPRPCRVSIRQAGSLDAPHVVVVPDGVLQLEADTPGRYTILAEAVRYLPRTFEVDL